MKKNFVQYVEWGIKKSVFSYRTRTDFKNVKSALKSLAKTVLPIEKSPKTGFLCKTFSATLLLPWQTDGPESKMLIHVAFLSHTKSVVPNKGIQNTTISTHKLIVLVA
jgi:hypothetical protein